MSPAARAARPVHLEIEGFRGWSGRQELSLEGPLILLVGANGSGKSSTLNAIEWCLFGGEVATKSSGIDERGEWLVENTDRRGPTSVALHLQTEEGRAILRRTRPVGAKVRDPDELVVERAGDEALVGEHVREWLQWNALPDWATWRQAFCQHQELLRSRLIQTADRSVQLGRMLGLEPILELGRRLGGLKPRDLAARAQSELAAIEGELERSAARPGEELGELERRFEARGLARAELGDAALKARVGAALEAGRRAATALELKSPVPDPDSASLGEALVWARDWEREVNRRKAELEGELRRVREDEAKLESALGEIEPADRRAADARAALERLGREHGSAEGLERQLSEARAELRALDQEEARADRTRALVRQAREVLEASATREQCPVCEQPAGDLLARLGARSAALADETAHSLEQRRTGLRGRLDRLGVQRAELDGARDALAGAERAHAGLIESVRRYLPAGPADTAAGDLAAEARTELRARQARAGLISGSLDAADRHLERHRAERELFELFDQWLRARARADAASGDLHELSAWQELDGALDEAAGLAGDVEVLQSLLRELQERRSAENTAAVNAGLEGHYRRIVGDAGGGGVRVEVVASPSKINYRLVDPSGRNVTPILNQAALNALSYAMLFAQAEDRWRTGRAAWLVLDDPGQSLDREHLEGLAQALVHLSAEVPVLVATTEGPLAESLRARAGADLRELRLSPATLGRPARLAEEPRP